MRIVATNEAKTHLSSLLQEVKSGEIIVISRGRKLLAKLIPYEEPIKRPNVGEMMDAPFAVPDEALWSMNEAELQSWGL